MDARVEDLRQGHTEWREFAACRDIEPDLFFPSGTGSSLQMQTDYAKAVCHGCLVLDRCLGFALGTDQTEGIWGGLTAHEREGARRALPSARTLETDHSGSVQRETSCGGG